MYYIGYGQLFVEYYVLDFLDFFYSFIYLQLGELYSVSLCICQVCQYFF